MRNNINRNTNPTPTGNNTIVIESTHDGSCTRSSSSGHIRPKVRRRSTTTETSKTALTTTTTNTNKRVTNKDAKETNVDELLEQTRLCMSRVLRPTETNDTSPSISNSVSRPTGILKTAPRYQSGIPSSKPTMATSTTYDTDSLAKEMGLPDHDHDSNNDNDGHDKRSSKPFIKEFVVERSQPKADPLPFVPSSSSVEGYSPSTTHHTSNTTASAAITADSGTPAKPLKTLSELLILSKTLTEQESQESQQAGHTRQTKTDRDTDTDGKSQMESFETDMEFTCMTKGQYDETVKLTHSLGVSMEEWMSSGEDNGGDGGSSDPNGTNMDRGGGAAEEADGDNHDDDDPALQDECELPTLEASPRDWNDVFFGKQSVFSDDHGIDDEKYEDDDDDSLNALDPSEEYDEDEEEEPSQPPPQPRPFMLLWNAISAWITPEAVITLHRLKKEAVGDLTYDCLAAAADGIETNFQNQQRQQSVSEKGGDIEASRRAALMAMLKMNVARSLSELGCGGIDGHARRIAETKLGQFVQCFDFSESMVKFDRKIWRAMTVVLLRIVLPDDEFACQEDLRSNGVDVDNGRGCDPGGQSLPTSIQDIGITLEEYHYLTKSAIRSLNFGSA